MKTKIEKKSNILYKVIFQYIGNNVALRHFPQIPSSARLLKKKTCNFLTLFKFICQP